MEADEGGIGNFDHGVVHLEVEESLDAARLHVLEAAVRLEGADHAAVSVGAHEHMAGGVEDDLAVCRHAGPHSLAEEYDVLGIEAEVVVLLEVGDRGVVVGGASHHVERNRGLVAHAEGEDLARVEVEERGACHGADGIRALGTIVAEARALPARDEQHAHASRGKLLLACGHGLLKRGALELRHLGRCGLAFLRGGRSAAREDRRAALQLLEVYRLHLREKRLALLRRKLLPELEHVPLAVFLENGLRLVVCHRFLLFLR